MVATLPVGYADGYIRAYNKGEGHCRWCSFVLLLEECAWIQCMIRLPHEYPVGTKVTLLGKNKEEDYSN